MQNESTPQPDDVSRRHVSSSTNLAVGLLGLALLLSFLAFVGRPDSAEDAVNGKIFVLMILSPAWAGFAFVFVRSRVREKSWRDVFTIIMAIAAWILSAVIFISWENLKFSGEW